MSRMTDRVTPFAAANAMERDTFVPQNATAKRRGACFIAPLLLTALLVDLPASTPSIAEGAFASSVTPRGKPGPHAPQGARQGINDYTGWFASDKDMSGQYFGYDGPCPPWNDEIAHRYVFTVFALDVARLAVPDRFTGADARRAMDGHILARASVTGRYSLNPSVTL